MKPVGNELDEIVAWPLGKRVALGVGMGTLFSVALAGFAAVTYVLSGAIFDPLQFVLLLVRAVFFGGSLSETDFSLGRVALCYLAGGFLGGVLGGMLVPFARSRLGAVFSGAAVFAPLHAASGVIIENSVHSWAAGTVSTVILTSVLAGGWAGYQVWEQYDLDKRLTEPVSPDATTRRRFRQWKS